MRFITTEALRKMLNTRHFFTLRETIRFKQDAFIEDKLRLQEKRDYGNHRIVDEDEEDLIRCIASQFSLSIR